MGDLRVLRPLCLIKARREVRSEAGDTKKMVLGVLDRVRHAGHVSGPLDELSDRSLARVVPLRPVGWH